jgi:hypothetical protein
MQEISAAHFVWPRSSWDHPFLAKADFSKATCDGTHPGIILPSQLGGVIILPSSWRFKAGFI